MTEQPEALRLAEILEGDYDPEWFYEIGVDETAAELRRLHEEVNEQSRLLGMSAERELALLAKIDRLERQLGEAVWNYGEKVRANQELLAPLKLVLEALDVLMTEPIAHKAADKAEYLLLEASPAIREALAEQPAQGCEFCSHPLYAGTKCKNCGREQSAQQQVVEHQPCKGMNCGITRTDQEHSLECQAEHAAAIAGGAFVKPAQQEPVVWMYVNKSTHETKFQKHMRDFVDHSLWSEVPLYGEPLANHELQCVCGAVWLGDELVHLPDKRPPAQRKPLTDEEIIQFAQEWPAETNDWASHIDFARAIEAAHGIKGEA